MNNNLIRKKVRTCAFHSFCAYTLVEILLVASIIAVIMGLIMGATIKARHKAKLTQTQVLLDQIGAAMRMYVDDFGSYPPDGAINRYPGSIAGSSAECLYYYLGASFRRGVNASVFAGPYMNFEGSEVKVSRVTACDFDGDGAMDDDLKEILDPWGKALRYRQPPSKNLNTYDLYSYGPNGVDNAGLGDDINNWE